MAHAVVEYTNNLGPDADIRGLLNKIARAMVDTDGVFPIGGIRVRAIKLEDYVVADGQADDAFVNIEVRMAAGRPDEFKQQFFSALFDMAKAHFAPLAAQRYFALSMYVQDLPALSFKDNNIHARFRKG